MTALEKLLLETHVNNMRLIATNMVDNGAIFMLIADHLPGLTDSDRENLRIDAAARMTNAEAQRKNAAELQKIADAS